MLAAWYKKQMEIKAREEGREEGREKGREEGREKGREEGRESERKAWQDWRMELQAWERRRTEAERAGIAFAESPPAAPDADQFSAV